MSVYVFLTCVYVIQCCPRWFQWDPGLILLRSYFICLAVGRTNLYHNDDIGNHDDENPDIIDGPNDVQDGSNEILDGFWLWCILWVLAVWHTNLEVNDDTKNRDDENPDINYYPNAPQDGSNEILDLFWFVVILWILAVGRTNLEVGPNEIVDWPWFKVKGGMRYEFRSLQFLGNRPKMSFSEIL